MRRLNVRDIDASGGRLLPGLPGDARVLKGEDLVVVEAGKTRKGAEK